MIYAAYSNLSAPSAFAAAAVSAAGALFPDIDISTSKLGAKFKPVSVTISKLFGHRTLFHSPLLYLTISIFLSRHFPQFNVYWTAFFLGVISHLLLDMLNPKGIPLLYPYPKRYRLARIKCGGKGEKAVQVMLIFMILSWIGIFTMRGEIALPNVLKF